MADTTVEFEYPVKVEDVAPSTKKLSIEIPEDRIMAKLSESMADLRSKASLPGFRPGRAPQKLVEKRFGPSLREDVKRELLSESYQQAIERNKLDVIGEPEFDKPGDIQLPESGPLSFTFQVEIRPAFTVPQTRDIPVKRPKVQVNDTHIEQAMKNLREQQGTLVPVEGRGLEAKDYITADFILKHEGKEIGNQKDAQCILQAGRVGGIFVEDLDKQLAGLKLGESKTLTVKAPDDHAHETIRGKDIDIEVTLKDIKKLELAEINQEFLDSLGFKDEAELRDALKEQMEIRINNDVQQAMRDQVTKYLMDNIQMELPAKLTQRQTARTIQRRASDLMMRGVPVADIEANIEKIKAGADQQAATELKSFFILDKIAADENVNVTEDELNGQIAMIAMQTGERPEKLRQRLAKDGTLQNMYLKLRENKALDKLIESAKIEEVEVEEKKA